MPTVRTPTVRTQTVRTPTVQTPTVQTPRVHTPTIQTPTIQTPTIQTPTVQTPTVQTPTGHQPPGHQVTQYVNADTSSALREIIRNLTFCVCDGALAGDSSNILSKTHLSGCELIESCDTHTQDVLMQHF